MYTENLGRKQEIFVSFPAQIFKVFGYYFLTLGKDFYSHSVFLSGKILCPEVSILRSVPQIGEVPKAFS